MTVQHIVPLPLITKINSLWEVFFLAVSDLPVCYSSHPQWAAVWSIILLPSAHLWLAATSGIICRNIKTFSPGSGGKDSGCSGTSLAAAPLLVHVFFTACCPCSWLFVLLNVTEYFSIKMNNKFCVKWEWLQAVEFGTELLLGIVYKCFNTLCYHNPYTVQTHMHKLCFSLGLAFSCSC